MERLILCGGGHVSLEVAHIARRLEFELVIIDDRPEFASRDRFPMAGQVVCAPFLEALDALGSRESDYYVILTRGHAHDRDCLEHVLRGKYAYAGMIGSRTKVAAVKAALEAAGIAREILDGVHSPIGLPIGAQTPAEIAVSIAAELVQERARRGPAAVPPAVGEPGVLCTITAKRGSAPRGVGTWMLVRPDGSVLGTIGGGAVEHLAVHIIRGEGYMKGTLYCIGVGPGDPELLTLKAWKRLRSCSVLAVPQGHTGVLTAKQILLHAIEQNGDIDVSQKKVLVLDFPMTRDAAVLSRAHAAGAAAIEQELQQGRDVALITLGCPTVYAT